MPLNLHDKLDASSTNLLISQSPNDDPQILETVPRRSSHRFLVWVVNVLVLCLSLFTIHYSITKFPADVQCGRQLSTYSPVLEAIEYQSVYFNGTLHHPSPYRGPPNDELDATWDPSATDFPTPIRVEKDTLLRAGKPARLSRARFREGGGGYMCTIEFTHQLHCLNALRKVTYRDYYESRGDPFFHGSAEMLRTHIDHCIEMLRQFLMCNADTGIIIYEWVKGVGDPYANFNTRHTCRNYNKLMDWYYDHQVHMRKEEFSRLEDTVDLPTWP